MLGKALHYTCIILCKLLNTCVFDMQQPLIQYPLSSSLSTVYLWFHVTFTSLQFNCSPILKCVLCQSFLNYYKYVYIYNVTFTRDKAL